MAHKDPQGHVGPEYAEDTDRMVAPFTIRDYTLLKALPGQIADLSSLIQQAIAATRAETSAIRADVATIRLELTRGLSEANKRIDSSDMNMVHLNSMKSRALLVASIVSLILSAEWAVFTNWDKVIHLFSAAQHH